jgi:MoxR-like ATPase
MFESFEDLMSRLKATGYFIDPVMTRIVFLAAKLQKPLLLEGPAGSGKTQLAVSVAQAAGTHIERLQCYRGVTEDKAIGRFDESLQRLYMEFSKGQDAGGRAGNWRGRFQSTQFSNKPSTSKNRLQSRTTTDKTNKETTALRRQTSTQVKIPLRHLVNLTNWESGRAHHPLLWTSRGRNSLLI